PAVGAAEQRQRQDKGVPEHAIAESADNAEEPGHRLAGDPAIARQAQAPLAAEQFEPLPASVHAALRVTSNVSRLAKFEAAEFGHREATAARAATFMRARRAGSSARVTA